MRFILDIPNVVLQPKAEEKGFEVWSTNPDERVAVEVREVEVFLGNVEGTIARKHGVVAIWSKI